MSDKYANQKPTVSLITVTQYSRRACLTNLIELIREQIYDTIVEWVIVEGSQDQADADANQLYLASQYNAIESLPLNVVYIPYEEDQSHCLSDLRNLGNLTATGEIIVCMDDDDYYPPTRVSHAVHRLVNSTALIAGCSRIFIYFYTCNLFFQFKSFGKTHSTNNCMAYKREYLENHAYKSRLNKAEETSFTNHFTEPMEQLDPHKCIVVSSHGSNTVDKSWLCDNTNVEAGKNRMVNEFTPEEIVDYIPFPIFKRMQKIFAEM